VVVDGHVTGRRFAGDHTVLTVEPPSGPTLRVPVWGTEAPAVGSAVRVALDPARVHLLEGD
jgi:hypothetical protein